MQQSTAAIIKVFGMPIAVVFNDIEQIFSDYEAL